MEPGEKKIHKGVYLLPNALTTGALFAGFYSIIAGINGNFIAAAVAVVIAGVLDGLDGRVEPGLLDQPLALLGSAGDADDLRRALDPRDSVRNRVLAMQPQVYEARVIHASILRRVV